MKAKELMDSYQSGEMSDECFFTRIIGLDRADLITMETSLPRWLRVQFLDWIRTLSDPIGVISVGGLEPFSTRERENLIFLKERLIREPEFRRANSNLFRRRREIYKEQMKLIEIDTRFLNEPANESKESK